MNPHKLICTATIALAASAAHAAVITDFSSFTATPTLEGTRPQTFSTTTGVGTNTVIGTAGAGAGVVVGQHAFLSDSFSLATVGARISASLGSFAGTPNNSQSIGLAVASSESITSRVNLITFQYRREASSRLVFNSFNNSGQFVNTGIATSDTPDSIFIERTSTGYRLGTITAAVETTTQILDFTFTNASNQLVVSADGTAVIRINLSTQSI